MGRFRWVFVGILVVSGGCAAGEMFDPFVSRDPERCDGMDNDGDGDVDEGHF